MLFFVINTCYFIHQKKKKKKEVSVVDLEDLASEKGHANPCFYRHVDGNLVLVHSLVWIM